MKIEEAVDRMNKTIEQFHKSIVGIQSGTVSPGLISSVKVNYHGQLTPIKHLATTSQSKSGISIDLYDPSIVGVVCNALKGAGFNAYTLSKTVVMVNIEPPSGEQKLEVISHLKKIGEEAKISVRNIRRKCKQKLKLPIDQQREAEKQLQEYTDQAIALIDEAISNKVGKI